MESMEIYSYFTMETNNIASMRKGVMVFKGPSFTIGADVQCRTLLLSL